MLELTLSSQVFFIVAVKEDNLILYIELGIYSHKFLINMILYFWAGGKIPRIIIIGLGKYEKYSSIFFYKTRFIVLSVRFILLRSVMLK